MHAARAFFRYLFCFCNVKIYKAFLGAFTLDGNWLAVHIELDISHIRDAVYSVHKAFECVIVGHILALKVNVNSLDTGCVCYYLPVGFRFFTDCGCFPICHGYVKPAMLEERGEKLAPRFLELALVKLKENFLHKANVALERQVIEIGNTVGVCYGRGGDKDKLCFAAVYPFVIYFVARCAGIA